MESLNNNSNKFENLENKILKINEDLNNQKNNILQKDFKEDLNYYNKQNEENNLKYLKKENLK